MFGDKMVTPAIPERVYALCKLIEKGPATNVDLKDRMEPVFFRNRLTIMQSFLWNKAMS